MKTLSFIIVFSLVLSFVYGQKELKLILKSDDGKILKQDADVYHVQNAKIKGLTSEKEWKRLYNTITKDSLIKKFEYKGEPVNDERDVLITIKSKKEEDILRFLKNNGFTKVVLNTKEFGLDQVQEFKNELNALKLKAQSEKMQKNRDKRALPQIDKNNENKNK